MQNCNQRKCQDVVCLPPQRHVHARRCLQFWSTILGEPKQTETSWRSSVHKNSTLVVPSLSTILFDSRMNNAGRENFLDMDLANSVPWNTTKKDHPSSDSRRPFCTLPLSGPPSGKENSIRTHHWHLDTDHKLCTLKTSDRIIMESLELEGTKQPLHRFPSWDSLLLWLFFF